MSKITTIYDALVTRLSAIYTSHFRLPNAYQVEQNPESWLLKGYALQVSPATNLNLKLSCQMSIARQFTVVLTREFKALDLDVTHKSTTEKDLLEDQYLLVKDFEKTVTVNDPAVAGCIFQGDSGILSVFPDKNNFLKLESIFTIRYFENLN